MIDKDRIDDRASEAWDKAKGKTNDVVGAARGDTGQQLKGKGQQIKGNLKGGINDMRRDADRDRGL